MNKLWLIIISTVLVLFYLVDYKLDKANSVDPDLIQSIIKRGYLIVGVKTDTKPFGYIENGKNVGFDIDIAKYIAKDILHDENKVKFIPVNTENRLYKLNLEKADIVIATMTITSDRVRIIDFSKPYFLAGQALLINNGSHIYGLSDLFNKNVGVLFGSTAEKNIRLLMPSAYVLGYRTYKDAYSALKAGRVLAILSDDTILRGYSMSDSTVKLLPKRYSKEFYGIGVRKDQASKGLLNLINLDINNMINDGTLIQLKRKWQLL